MDTRTPGRPAWPTRGPTVLRVQTPDPRAGQILKDAYWTSGGWREQGAPGSDVAYAVEAGLVFEGPRRAGHDEVVAGVTETYSKIVQQEVVDCFLASLSSRRLDLRSALSSYVIVRHLRPHPFEPGPDEISGA